jgi:hypothetical protein
MRILLPVHRLHLESDTVAVLKALHEHDNIYISNTKTLFLPRLNFLYDNRKDRSIVYCRMLTKCAVGPYRVNICVCELLSRLFINYFTIYSADIGKIQGQSYVQF